jgi:hypothetical protein
MPLPMNVTGKPPVDTIPNNTQFTSIIYVAFGSHRNLYEPVQQHIVDERDPNYGALVLALIGIIGGVVGLITAIGSVISAVSGVATALCAALTFTVIGAVICAIVLAIIGLIAAIAGLIGAIIAIKDAFTPTKDHSPGRLAPYDIPTGPQFELATAGNAAMVPVGVTDPAQGAISTASILHIVNQFRFDSSADCDAPPWWTYAGRWGIRAVPTPVTVGTGNRWDNGARRVDPYGRTLAHWNMHALVEASHQMPAETCDADFLPPFWG